MSKGYLQFGGKIRRRRRRIKRMRCVRNKGQRGGVMAPLLASTLAPVATNLLNGILGRLF